MDLLVLKYRKKKHTTIPCFGIDIQKSLFRSRPALHRSATLKIGFFVNHLIVSE